MDAIFVTGTGTDIGKTIVSLALCHLSVQKGKKTAYYKPVQCGELRLFKGGRNGGDSALIKHFLPQDIDTSVCYDFKNPVSPHLAAVRENFLVEKTKIIEMFNALCLEYDVVIMEGTGGCAVPLNESGTTLPDIMSGLPVKTVMVCAPYLGTISHSVTASFFIKQKQLSAHGFIMSHSQPEIPDIFLDNIEIIKRMTGLPYLGEVGYLKELQSGKALKAGEFQNMVSGLAVDELF
ncbi:MAG: dethiobiotin synthase [Fibrobacteria bacterium]|nr:dethiobiotin synthase [Fibrobacteria bacterium]